ncbi:MAG TPA: amidohydrolase family protein, partial [Nitrososphaeraceae archaeon]|nr:amidohydrolase family protein [Nitrososphaeraceae archaeon]
DKGYQRVYDMCVEYDAPVMIHTGDTFSNTAKIRFSHPLTVDDIAVDNPELKIVMCHLGNPWIVDCQEVIYKNRNVYADISGLFIGDFTQSVKSYYVNKIKELLSYVGDPHRILYGTDWPISDIESYIKLVQSLNLDQRESDLLMFGNAKKIFRL